MINEIIFKKIGFANLEDCRELCDELMKYQKRNMSMWFLKPFYNYNFNNRLKLEFKEDEQNYLLVAYHKHKPIGYIHCDYSYITNKDVFEDKNSYNNKALAFFINLISILKLPINLSKHPKNRKVPSKVSTISTIYVKKDYRKLGVGKKLMDMSFEWLNSIPQLDYITVYVLNGNNGVVPFYEQYGFKYSHSIALGTVIGFEIIL